MGRGHLRPMPALTGDIDDPEFRRARAVKAGRASQSLDAKIAAIERRVDELTSNQLTRLIKVVRHRSLRATRLTTKATRDEVLQCEGQRTIDDQLRENGAHV